MVAQARPGRAAPLSQGRALHGRISNGGVKPADLVLGVAVAQRGDEPGIGNGSRVRPAASLAVDDCRWWSMVDVRRPVDGLIMVLASAARWRGGVGMGGPATYTIKLRALTGAGRWTLWADGELIAMFHGGIEAAMIEAARTLDDLHGVLVGGWTENNIEGEPASYLATSVAVAPDLDRPPFTFEPGRPRRNRHEQHGSAPT